MTMVTTNIDRGSVQLRDCQFRDETLTFAAADTFVKGTILARRLVALAVVAAPDGGNTGNGTVTAATVVDGPVVPLVGAYVLRCTAAVTHGGTFRLEDPNGAIVATGLAMTAGAGAATVIEVAGLRFTVTDGSTDFAVGDLFTLTVAADGTLVPYNPAGAGGEQRPVAVLPYAATRASGGTLPARVIVSGVVNKRRLVIDVDGDGDNITNAILDQLRAAGIVALDVSQLADLDTQ